MSKSLVKEHWEREACGTRYSQAQADRRRYFREIEQARYRLEPHIPKMARFESARGQRVLEVGVGAGTDFIQWCRNGACAVGIDLTIAGARLTRERVALEGQPGDVFVGDAENLPFRDGTFDVVYSYGVLHHSPNTRRAFSEAYRVLKKGGRGVFMIYHLWSWTTLLLWVYYGLLRGHPHLALREVVSQHLESPGTKAYTRREARALARDFREVQISTVLGLGDLLTHELSAKYQDPLSRALVRLYPRAVVKAFGHRFGIGLWIHARK